MKEKKIRRINLFAGPGSGKSALAAELFAFFKKEHRNCELVREVVKDWVYEKRSIKPFSQWVLFGKQFSKEYVCLSNDVDFIITDSPIFLGLCYANLYDTPCWGLYMEQERVYDEHFESINIFIKRSKDAPYQEVGRLQNKEEAAEVDSHIKNMLDVYKKTYTEFDVNDVAGITKYIKQYLDFGKDVILPAYYHTTGAARVRRSAMELAEDIEFTKTLSKPPSLSNTPVDEYSKAVVNYLKEGKKDKELGALDA